MKKTIHVFANGDPKTCPNCGSENIRSEIKKDEKRAITYEWVYCAECGFEKAYVVS